MSRFKEEDPQKEKAYGIATEFAGRFKSINGTVLCKELLGCDLSTPEGRKAANEGDLFITLCPKFVRDAAAILKEML